MTKEYYSDRASIKKVVLQIANADIAWEVLAGTSILITGANGFLPAYIVETLLHLNDTKFEKKAHVYALVRNKKNADKKFQQYADRDDLAFLYQDVCEPISFEGRLDYIIHAASQASPKYFGKDPLGTIAPNVMGTHMLLSLAQEKKSACFFYVSSAEVYGSRYSGAGAMREDTYGSIDPLDVRSCYAEGKRCGEALCNSWHHQYGVPFKVVRPFHVYGPGMHLNDGRVYADFVSDVVQGKDISMHSDGSAERSFCYISDAIAAFFTVLVEGSDGQAYNIGNANMVACIRDFADLLVSLFPEKKLAITKGASDVPGYVSSRVTSCVPDTKKLEALGWRAQVSLKDGLTQTVKSYE